MACDTVEPTSLGEPTSPGEARPHVGSEQPQTPDNIADPERNERCAEWLLANKGFDLAQRATGALGRTVDRPALGIEQLARGVLCLVGEACAGFAYGTAHFGPLLIPNLNDQNPSIRRKQLCAVGSAGPIGSDQ